jgi:hypothetical protein
MNAKWAGCLVVLACGVPLSGALFAQDQFAPKSVARPEQPAATAPVVLEPTAIRAGRIRKKDGQYVLRESASKQDYVLDDQKIAKRYNGRVVFITGTVNDEGKTIHVMHIEVAA